VAEVQRVAGKIKGRSSQQQQQQQQAVEVVHPPVQVAPAHMAAPSWLLPGLLGAGAAAAVGFAAVTVGNPSRMTPFGPPLCNQQ
jgi:hypothetical protein